MVGAIVGYFLKFVLKKYQDAVLHWHTFSKVFNFWKDAVSHRAMDKGFFFKKKGPLSILAKKMLLTPHLTVFQKISESLLKPKPRFNGAKTFSIASMFSKKNLEAFLETTSTFAQNRTLVSNHFST